MSKKWDLVEMKIISRFKCWLICLPLLFCVNHSYIDSMQSESAEELCLVVCVFFDYLAKGHVRICLHLASIVRRKLSHLNLLLWNQGVKVKQNFTGMVLGWFPFKIISHSPALHSRWLLLLKIEISSIVHCCIIINQNELKF